MPINGKILAVALRVMLLIIASLQQIRGGRLTFTRLFYMPQEKIMMY